MHMPLLMKRKKVAKRLEQQSEITVWSQVVSTFASRGYSFHYVLSRLLFHTKTTASSGVGSSTMRWTSVPSIVSSL